MIWNVYDFFTMYAEVDKVDSEELEKVVFETRRSAGPSSRAAAASSSAAASGTVSENAKQPLQKLANLFTSVLLAEEKSFEMLNDLPSTKNLSDLVEMNTKKELSSTAMKEVFLRLFDPQMKQKTTKEITKELGLIQENDTAALEKIVDTVLKKPETKKAQEDYKSGQEKVLGFLVGQVMKESHGKANPAAVQEILKQKLA